MLTKRHLVTAFTTILLVVCSSVGTSQTEWIKHAGNPVLSPETPPAWDQTYAGANTVMFHDGVFKMWYEGDNSFGYATSPDGIAWTKYAGNPVMVPGPIGSWDEDNIDNASVIAVADSFHMWYSGVDSLHDNRIGHATSPDGIVWTKDPANPVIDLDNPFGWDSHEAMHPFVIYENNVFKMWYNGHDGITQRILYATSPDGTVWTRFTSFFMLEPGAPGRWDDWELGPLCALRAQGGYHMWYTAWNQTPEYAIGYATSPDGLTWTKDTDNNPVLERGSAGSWDDSLVVIPNVLLMDSVLTMWYSGSDGSLGHTGRATSITTLVPTFLQSYDAAWTEFGVEINWLLSEAGTGARFSVLRNEPPDEDFVPLSGSEIRADGLRYTFTDETVEPGSAYRYLVMVSDEDGERRLFETELITIPALTVALNRISPNPFNPHTTIAYTIADTGPVTLGVYDAGGRLIRKLVDRPHAAGRYAETWDGRNQSGATVASGVYFVRLESRGHVTTKKAVLSK
jgi:hypothetical protein